MGVPHTREGMIVQTLYISERELAVRLNLNINTVRRWRKEGIGPAYTLLGPRLIGYQLSAVEAWEASRTVLGLGRSQKQAGIAA